MPELFRIFGLRFHYYTIGICDMLQMKNENDTT